MDGFFNVPFASRRPGRAMRTTLTVALLFLIQWRTVTADIWSNYERCKTQGFGTTSLVCDPDRVLENSTTDKLSHILQQLHSRIPCQCKNRTLCLRPKPTPSSFLGLLQIEAGNNDTESELNTTTARIYEDAKLGVPDCDNGLVIVYLKDKKQLVTNGGPGKFAVLKEVELTKLHKLAKNFNNDNNRLADMQSLSAGNDGVLIGEPNVQRAETWTPLLGLFIAIIIVLIVLALLLALLLARFCCCCVKNKKSTRYQVNTLGTYKTLDPIYIVTPPPPADRDPIYSTPYNTNSLPPPFISHPNTPASTHRQRIIPSASMAIPRPFITPSQFQPYPLSAAESTHDNSPINQTTPTVIKDKRPSRSSTPGSTKAEIIRIHPVDLPSTSGIVPQKSPKAHSVDGKSLQRSLNGGYTESDLSFLDPKRKQETQTREDYIY